MRRVLDVFADVPREAVQSDLFRSEEDANLVVVGAHDNGLRCEAPGDGVLVSIEPDAIHLGHVLGLEVVRVETAIVDFLEEGPLLVLEDERRDFANDLVNAVIGERVAPLDGLAIEIEQIGEAATWPEAVANETNGALDAAFFMRFLHVARGDGEAA